MTIYEWLLRILERDHPEWTQEKREQAALQFSNAKRGERIPGIGKTQ